MDMKQWLNERPLLKRHISGEVEYPLGKTLYYITLCEGDTELSKGSGETEEAAFQAAYAKYSEAFKASLSERLATLHAEQKDIYAHLKDNKLRIAELLAVSATLN